MSKKRDAVTPARWEYLKQLKPRAPWFFHVSQEYRWAEHTSETGVVTNYWQPYFTGPHGPHGSHGRTFYYPKPVAGETQLAGNPVASEGVTL
jgi:hypothetical protein